MSQIKDKSPEVSSESEPEPISEKPLAPIDYPLSFKQGSLESYVLFTLIFFIGVYLAGKFIKEADSMASKIRYSIAGLNILAVLVSYLLLPKPNYKSFIPWFFRLFQALGFVYFLNLLFMTILDAETLRSVLVALDPRLMEPLKERNYSIDCTIYTPNDPTSKFRNIMDTMDIFVSAHFIGWAVKTLIFRNNLLAWLMSFAFEIYELSLRHWLPNFYECWWDHIFLDLFGCNMAGILFASWLMKKYKIEKYHWFFDPTEKTEKISYFRRLSYSLFEAKPYLETHQWHWLASPGNFMVINAVVLMNSLTDLSNFLNKKMLNIPPHHYLMVIRIWILGFYSILAISELYQYSRSSGEKKKMTFNFALSWLIVGCEWILFYKNFRPEFFVETTPLHVKLFWGTFACIWLFLFGLSIRNSKKKLWKC